MLTTVLFDMGGTLEDIWYNSDTQKQVCQKLLEGKGAWRVHGGGFAGTVQAYVPLESLEEFRGAMEQVFGEGTCYTLSVRQAGGTRVTL